ncbi:histidine phosphatase family protein [Falsiroseomonas tokyonensis]|uniref:Histidine phosphatase family protein n=1 Tax=Falsiroseomonas tokyonensis TaxID=430521 RepID=A0ABV7BRW2_9PROT|nr:histidine phosphatase family protein [Falsiroseomonas tokyonensis]MBU8537569.1 histidine phosphatase family protein [Falsiroseomonas tokyonensis]
MAQVHFLTHPEVAIDPAVPVPDWPLSPRGLERARAMLAQPWVPAIRSVFSSEERKARDMAEILAAHRGLPVTQLAALGENDRSATGYLPPAEFEAVADEFFAEPARSVRGWERAADAQARIVGAVRQVLAQAPPGDVAIVAHGGVGALLLCHIKGVKISRAEDQPGRGGGNGFRFAREDWRLLEGWRRVEG